MNKYYCRYKRTVQIIVVVIFSSILISCGEKESEDTESKVRNNIEIENTDTKEDSVNSFKKDKTVQKEDIISDMQIRVDYLSSLGFQITNFEIIKRQTNLDDKEDVIYVHFDAQNNDFSIARNYQLQYILYNEGWLLEEVNPYSQDGYFDETISLHGVDSEEVESYFANVCASENIEEPEFHNSLIGVTYSDIENTLFDNNCDCYCQQVQFTYELFTRTVWVNVQYTLNGFVWEPYMSTEEEYSLNDNISGRWVSYIKATNPMHLDSTISLDITKIDNLNCSYDFLWTSRIQGGYGQTFNGTKEIVICHNSSGYLNRIEVCYDSAWGDSIYITPEGLLYVPGLSTEKYLLTKED